MKLDRLGQLRCMQQALELCDNPHADEFEGLREAYLAQRERPAEPQQSLPLKVAQDTHA